MDMRLSNGARAVFEALKNAGFRADVVGGSVRDFLLGLSPHDFDMTTSATPEEMLRVFGDFKVIETGRKHGTLTVIVEGEPVEVTTYRTDGDYADHRHPENVTFTRDLSSDLSRRDFTVNAMCYHPTFGITDLFGGREDIEKRRIRCVGEPSVRFREDALRILRALRFASVLGFSVEEKTKAAVLSCYELLADVSAERIYAEWRKARAGKNPAAVLREYSQVFAFLFPGVPLTVPEAFGTEDDKHRTLELLWNDKDRAAHFAAMCRRLKTEKKFLDDGVAILGTEDVGELSRGGYLRLCFSLGKERARDFLLLSDLSDGGSRLSAFDALMAENPPTKLSDLALRGGDLLSAGFDGTALGDALEKLLFAVMDGKVKNEKSSLLSFLRENDNKT